MQIVSSYKARILSENVFNTTIEIYRSALSYLIGVFDKEWNAISSVSDALERQNYAEKLIHSTKANQAAYPDFDKKYYKFPTYLRRSVVSSALGAVSSYRSNLKNWEANGRVGKGPRLQHKRNTMPVFYRDNTYLTTSDPDEVILKLFHNNDWRWVKVRLRHTDMRYLEKKWSGVKSSAPILEKHYGKYYLRFAFTESVELSKTEIREQKICSVDLGINTDAVCSIMDSSGTVLARKFIDFPSDKDLLEHVTNRIRKHQREHGSHSNLRFWTYAQRLNTEHANKVAAAITEFASVHNVDCIVFEHLDMQGAKRGKKKQKLALWRKNTIQAVAAHKAHRLGIRISHICAWKTSKLAFDGSGEVERSKDNYSLCTFKTGKRYNCDLNASYNIGARYFIRELLKPLPATERSRIGAKVPGIELRTSNTLSTLKALSTELCAV